jgi:histidinol phosphatase-like enzyme
MNTKLALGFILYKPTNNTIDRILKHSNDGYKIFIYDNDEINNTQKFIHQNIHYYSNFRNEGLSVGLNYLCAIAKKNGFTSLLYFDQDTIFIMKSKFISDLKKISLKAGVFNAVNYSNEIELRFEGRKRIRVLNQFYAKGVGQLTKRSLYVGTENLVYQDLVSYKVSN